MPQAAPLRPGDPDRLGAYRLIGRLGEGGQGTVYLAAAETAGESAGAATDPAPGARVAIKLLHARLSAGRDLPVVRAR